MEDVSLADAKEHLEELIARASRGEDVRIVRPRRLERCELLPAAEWSDASPEEQRRLGCEGKTFPAAS